LHEQERSCRVPKVVDAASGKLGDFKDLLEAGLDVARIDEGSPVSRSAPVIFSGSRSATLEASHGAGAAAAALTTRVA
jgi:hypothetical protein